VRGCVIDYLAGREETVKNILASIRSLLTSEQLTLEDVIAIIDRIEEDPLCIPHITKAEKTEKLNQLRKALSKLTDLEAEE